jgi:hypothetical protein
VAEQDQRGEGEQQRSRMLAIRLDEFGWEALEEESRRLGVSNEDLARFSVLYYLADVDSGRIAREVPGTVALRDR